MDGSTPFGFAEFVATLDRLDVRRVDDGPPVVGCYDLSDRWLLVCAWLVDVVAERPALRARIDQLLDLHEVVPVRAFDRELATALHGQVAA